jgi:hypothetical protein
VDWLALKKRFLAALGMTFCAFFNKNSSGSQDSLGLTGGLKFVSMPAGL